ncbi:MAG TPA: PEGA domain-containing protein, partial [Fibrobacteraceae bacterium]|nr:PEGA domain-containing protein [Fibrobacteraceae bacterium]
MRLYLKLFVLFGLTSMPMAQEYDTTPTDSAISFSPTAAAPEFAPAFEPLAETSSDSLTTDTETNTAQSPAESVPPSQEKPALEISSDNPAVHFRIQEQVIQDSLDLVIRDQGKVRSEVETGMTPLRPKDEFETTASFETRKSAWEKDRDAKAATQLAPLMQKEKALRESLAKVHKDAAAQQGFLRIESEPQGAKVFVDGVESGKTPATVEHLWAGRRKVVLQLDGFQEFIATPDVQGSETTKLKAKLEEKSIFSEPHEVNLSALLAQDTPSVVVYQTRIAALLARISEVNEEAAAMLSDLKLKRPLQPKGEFETQAEFDKRQKEWLKAGQTEYAKIQQKQGEYVTRLQRAIEVLQDYILVQAGSPKAHLVPGNQMMLGAYNADAEQYPFTAENQEADYAFHWEGAMNIPVADAKAMNRQTEDCQLRAMYYDI